jgi:DNA-binding NarL/FixJ family response regulator
MRVVIAEDTILVLEGLTRLLAGTGIEVAAAVSEAESFLGAVDTQQPDVVVVDVRLPPGFSDEGLRAALVVRQRWPGTGVLMLSQYVEERYATELLGGRTEDAAHQGQRGGEVGYLLKDRVGNIAERLDALHRVASGGSALDPEVVSQLLTRRGHPLDTLTARERQVLALMAEGALEHRDRGCPGRRVRSGREAHQRHLRLARAAPDRGRPPPGPGCPRLPGHLTASVPLACDRGVRRRFVLLTRASGLSQVG